MNTQQARRQGWKSFLTPGWVITAVLVLLFTYFAITFLAPWQLNKGERKSEFNHRLEAAVQRDPVGVEQVLPKDGTSAGIDKEWTHVRMQGHFLLDAEGLLRNRPINGSPAYHVLTPFRTDAGQTVLVNRGWTMPVNGAEVPTIPNPPVGEVTVTGFVRMSEAKPPAGPVNAQGFTQFMGINTEEIGQTQREKLANSGSDGAQFAPLTAEYVQLDEASVASMNDKDASDATLMAIPLPQLDNGPHLSYGIQWITFGIAAPAVLIWFAWSEIKERRREKDEIAEAEARAEAQAESRSAVQAGLEDGGVGSAFSEPVSSRGDHRGGEYVASRGSDVASGAGSDVGSRGFKADGESSADDQRIVGSGGADAVRGVRNADASQPDSRPKIGAGGSDAVKPSGAQRAKEQVAARKLAERYGGTRNRFEERRNARKRERF